MNRWVDALTNNRVWRSIVRHGYPDTNKNRTLLVFSNFFLHAHPVKARLRAFAFRRTLYLGGLSIGCFALLVVTGVALHATCIFDIIEVNHSTSLRASRTVAVWTHALSSDMRYRISPPMT